MPVGVVFDAWCLSEGASQRGVGTYVKQILAGLAALDDFAITALVHGEVKMPASVRQLRVARLPKHRYSQVEHELLLPFDLRRRRDIDVMFEPAPDPPIRPPVPLVQTLYDAIPYLSDAPDLAWAKKRWQRYPPRYRRAKAIIAISRYSADEGIEAYDLDPRRVHVAHLGVDRSVFTPDGPRETGPPYVVIVSEFSKRKGFDRSVAAVAGMAAAGLPHSLRAAGRIPPWIRDDLEAVRAASPRPDLVQLLDYVEDLPALYRGAAAMLVTSHHEGFGLPALEAMACGTPVVAFANTATAEVVGDGGLLIPDGDMPALIDALVRVAREPALAAELRERGLARAQQFSWERCVAIHADILRSVAKG